MSDKLILKSECDYVIPLTFDVGGIAVDITGSTVYFVIKKSPVDIDTNAIFKTQTTSHSDPVNGVTSISISKTDLTVPGRYIYAIAYTNAGGNTSETVTGDCIVEQKLNRRA